MDETDILLVRAAAQILARYGAEMMAAHDHLSTTAGFIGFRAQAAAHELNDFLAVAGRYGLHAADDVPSWQS